MMSRLLEPSANIENATSMMLKDNALVEIVAQVSGGEQSEGLIVNSFGLQRFGHHLGRRVHVPSA